MLYKTRNRKDFKMRNKISVGVEIRLYAYMVCGTFNHFNQLENNMRNHFML